MVIKYNIVGTSYELAKAISTELGKPMRYLDTARFVGDYIISAHGLVVGPDNYGLVLDLCGLYSFVPEHEEYSVAPPQAVELSIEEEEQMMDSWIRKNS